MPKLVSSMFCGDAHESVDQLVEACQNALAVPPPVSPSYFRELVPYFAEGDISDDLLQPLDTRGCSKSMYSPKKNQRNTNNKNARHFDNSRGAPAMKRDKRTQTQEVMTRRAEVVFPVYEPQLHIVSAPRCPVVSPPKPEALPTPISLLGKANRMRIANDFMNCMNCPTVVVPS
jgi:hypothetical protein